MFNYSTFQPTNHDDDEAETPFFNSENFQVTSIFDNDNSSPENNMARFFGEESENKESSKRHKKNVYIDEDDN